MFGHRFFGTRYYGPRYWGDGGSGIPPTPPATGYFDGGYYTEEDWKKHQVQILHPWERKPEPPVVIRLPSKSVVIELPPEEDEINEISRMMLWLDENGYLDDDDD